MPNLTQRYEREKRNAKARRSKGAEKKKRNTEEQSRMERKTTESVKKYV
jgi:hypothetical protein